MSRLSTHSMPFISRGNSARYHSHSIHHTPFSPTLNHSDNQAQFTAFTQPLMALRFEPHNMQTRPQTYPSTRPHIENHYYNQQSSIPTKNRTETAGSQPAYYVDSFPANFSDQPPSNSNNNNTKPKSKHVTFQEPELPRSVSCFLVDDEKIICELSFSESSSTAMTDHAYPPLTPSASWRTPMVTYPHTKHWPRHHYPSEQYFYNGVNPYYSRPMMNPGYMSRPRPMHMMSTTNGWP
jgi:hypothetical protein